MNNTPNDSGTPHRPILFAHRGARAAAPENTMEAFDLAATLGATGIETDAWTTADHVVVLDHDGAVRRGRSLRRTPIGQLRYADLPPEIPTWSELLLAHGSECDLSVDLKAPDTGTLIIDEVRASMPHRLPHVWLCHPDIEVLRELRAYDPDVALVHSIRLKAIDGSVERWAQLLSQSGIEAINFRQPDWSGGLVALFHRFGVRCFMWDAQTEHQLAEAFLIGIDGVYSDHVDRLVAAAELAAPYRNGGTDRRDGGTDQ